MQWAGARVLITGASGGIGAQFARALADRGADLVLAARSTDRLAALAGELRSSAGVQVSTVAIDLAQPGAGLAVVDRASQDGPVDALVNNAGFASHGAVRSTDPAVLSEQVQLNIGTVVDASRAVLPGMAERGRGAIVNVASTAAFQPLPLMAVYAASKSFVLSFTYALAHECAGSGVEVLAVCPGPVETGFFDRAGVRTGIFGPPAQVGDVVTAGLAALGRRAVVVPGLRNRAMGLATRFLPTAVTTRLAGQLARRG
jgi:short-subunit dehydrogenase